MNQMLANGGDGFLVRFRGLQARLPGDAGVRENAAVAFAAAGFPTVLNEAWKYTSLRGVSETSFQEPLNHQPNAG